MTSHIHVSGRPTKGGGVRKYIIVVNGKEFEIQGAVLCYLVRLAVAWPDAVNKNDISADANHARYLYRLRQQAPIKLENDGQGNYWLLADKVTIDTATVRQFPDVTIQRLMDDYEKRHANPAL